MTPSRYAVLAVALGLSPTLWAAIPGKFPNQESACSFDPSMEALRAASATSHPPPHISAVLINGVLAWSDILPIVPIILRPGDHVTLKGSGFGAGPDVDFSKIMIGNSRVLETDLSMYQQKLDILTQVNYEITQTKSVWGKDVAAWTDSQIDFTAPVHVSKGPLWLQTQKRTGYNESLIRSGEPHNIINAQTARIVDVNYNHSCDVVSILDQPKASNKVTVLAYNPNFDALLTKGKQIFWGYDYNLGLSHKFRGLDWSKILNYQTTDPITGLVADPLKLFGAYKTAAGEVPAEALNDIYFKPYPQTNPTPGFLLIFAQKTEGNTRNTGWAGYRYAQSSHPLLGNGEWIGFNCASCHGYRLSYQKGNSTITKVIPGLPNPLWTMKWSLLGTFKGVKATETGPGWSPGSATVDKTNLIYSMPQGAGEHTIIRSHGEGSLTDNDWQFSPIAIPNVTNYMAIRRSLSHTESYVGFEGSYIHSEEPDGALGSMDADSLKALTTYMTSLDENDSDLINAGLYRWLSRNGQLNQTGGAPTEGVFVSNGWKSYPGVNAAVQNGKVIFDRDCGACHRDGLGENTNEQMVRLDKVGRFFAPTIYQRDQQSIRATFLRDVYWVQNRGLLSDGHVRNVEDLVNPDRCTEGSALYNQYYTLHAPVNPAPGSADQPVSYPDWNKRGDIFRVPKEKYTATTDVGYQRNLAVLKHKYFVEVPWDPNYYYWDYQKMRAEYGPDELGSAAPIGMPAAPHPWCAANKAEVQNLVEYVLSL